MSAGGAGAWIYRDFAVGGGIQCIVYAWLPWKGTGEGYIKGAHGELGAGTDATEMLPAAGPRWVIAVIAGYFFVASAVIYFGITISRLRGLEGWELD